MEEIITLDDYYQKTDQFVSRHIAGEAVLVPLYPLDGNNDHIYSLNETAASAWDLMDGQHTLSAVVEAILAEFEVEENEAVQDVVGLAQALLSFGALEKV